MHNVTPRGATPNGQRIIVYGHPTSEFLTPSALIRNIENGIVENRCRYRYTQSNNARIIVLSRDGFAFGHFEILDETKPDDRDRAEYRPVKCVYIVGRRARYQNPVSLSSLGIRVNPYGLRISETKFDQIKMYAGHIQEFERVTPTSDVVDGINEEPLNIFRHYANTENHFTNGLSPYPGNAGKRPEIATHRPQTWLTWIGKLFLFLYLVYL